MSARFWLTSKQVERLRPHLPKARDKPRVDDRRVLSGILFILPNGLRWQDAPAVYGPHKTLYNRFVRWSRLEVFAEIFQDLALMIDSTHLKAHRTAASLETKGDPPARHRTYQGRPELQAAHGQRRQRATSDMSDAKGALVLLSELPPAKRLLGDKGYRAIVRHRLEDNGEGRLVAGRVGSPWPARLHSGPQYAATPCFPQPPALQKALPHRERLCPPQRLAGDRHALHPEAATYSPPPSPSRPPSSSGSHCEAEA
jgi:transposase